ncbi:nitroreductase family deazaflavin-dependent oxidoreductase [Agrococcus carbonis]|uniref:Deazaflavin-dependent oxidoreductase, nitroreductase family n=1 Tax=Agrococcus carbonis TaxID=684552 RepID=A0A1H1KU97_9MICO|nr:nitroreductase family deazaflavin-dependent oxidoreductase [Agrococcus carbonis]SDR65259.1 deazaflavin-dependent oxidoreductase, nitroreductase family [Agrococcus carbonis]
MAATPTTPKVPPRWFVRGAWIGHRLLYRTTGKGLARPRRDGKMGMLRLHTVGRKSGEPRVAIVGYLDHDGGFATLAMNGWAEADPAWWLNLKAQPETTVDTVDGPVRVRGREATGDEREQLWARFERATGWGEVESLSQRRHHTPVVVLERV